MKYIPLPAVSAWLTRGFASGFDESNDAASVDGYCARSLARRRKVAVAPTDILGVKTLFVGKPPSQFERLGHFVRASTDINGPAFAPTLSSATH